jgi:hypothetical protein
MRYGTFLRTSNQHSRPWPLTARVTEALFEFALPQAVTLSRNHGGSHKHTEAAEGLFDARPIPIRPVMTRSAERLAAIARASRSRFLSQ